MKPRDFLDVAANLITGVHEADWRSAVSRAYYGAFHAARVLFARCGFTVPKGDQAHAYLWLRLANSGHPDVEDAGNDLHDLRAMRNRADYDIDGELDQAVALAHVQTADSVFDLLEMAAGEPGVCARITDAMKLYERDVLKQVTWHA